MLGRCCNNFGVVVNEVLADGSANKLEVTVTIKALSKGTSHSTKLKNGGKDGIQREILKTKSPVVPCCLINQDECILETANGEAIAKSNIHMNRMKVFLFTTVNWTTVVGLTDCCI
jgi:hypothetical protein